MLVGLGRGGGVGMGVVLRWFVIVGGGVGVVLLVYCMWSIVGVDVVVGGLGVVDVFVVLILSSSPQCTI